MAHAVSGEINQKQAVASIVSGYKDDTFLMDLFLHINNIVCYKHFQNLFIYCLSCAAVYRHCEFVKIVYDCMSEQIIEKTFVLAIIPHDFCSACM